jgi:hypothetical protein
LKPLTSRRKFIKYEIPFSSSEHIYRSESLPEENASSILKAPGGLIRVSMAVDIKTRVINQILITGDFFA